METFVNQFPIVVLVQHNNLTVKEWFHFKEQILKKTNHSTFQFLNTKNSLLTQVLVENYLRSSLNFKKDEKQACFASFSESNRVSSSCFENSSLKKMCQGPNFLIGCHDSDQLQSLWNLVSSTNKCLFISCFYKKKLLNHLDLEILFKTNSSIYQTFLSNLDKKTQLHDTLQIPLQLHPLITLQTNLLLVFSALKQWKIQENYEK